jgi:cyclase
MMKAPREWQTGLVEVADGVFAYVQATGGFCISNAGLILGDGEALIIDTLFAPSMNRDFQAAVRRVTDRPPRLLVNTHHHVDHTLGNFLFPECRIIAHANARGEMERFGLPDYFLRMVPRWCDEIRDVPLRSPDVTFDGAMTLHIGGRRVELLHFGTAHTVGDVAVYLPEERVLFAGDLAFFWVTPVAFEGDIGKWIRVVDRLLEMDIDAVVPGHGPVGGLDDLRCMREYLALVRRQARRAYNRGLGEQGAAQGLRLGEYASWNEPERALINVQRLYGEFRHKT